MENKATKRTNRLGRGLSALIPDISTEIDKKDIITIDLKNIYPNQDQPRRVFDEEKINEVINKKYKDITPSGAEILDLCKEIKEEAFYLKKIRNKKLYIDEDVLKNVLDI